MHDVLRQIVAELKGSWRFRWIAVLVAWVVCGIGWFAVYAMPDRFESEATVYVDTISALKPLLGQMTIGNDVLSRVDLVATAMLGRPLLEKVARETDLHLRAKTRGEMDRLIFGMRERTDILNEPRRDPNLFRITYRDSDPVIAQSVVASMLNIFVEDSLGANRLDTQKAQEFLRTELGKLEGNLESSEKELANFKKSNVGRMPGEGGDYFVRLQTAIDELELTESKMSLVTRKREALRRQLAGEQPLLRSSAGAWSEVDTRISENQTRLEDLRLRFTERHPDVIAVTETLEQLRGQKEKQLTGLSDGGEKGIASDNPVFQNIQIELTNVSVEIETLHSQQASQKNKVISLRELIDILPEVEAELARLTRDYDVKRSQYQSLLQRLEVAELSESAERSEEVQFRIIDPPYYPEQPVAPNRPLLLFGVLVGALGLGGALAFLSNQFKPVFHDIVSLRGTTGLPVLGAVSVMRTTERRRRRIGQLAAFGMSVLLLCGFFVVALVLREPAGHLIRSLV